jgi:hypothetical protein
MIKPLTPEREIEAYLRKQCLSRNWMCLKWVSPSYAGVPDRIVLSNTGKVYFVELKAPRGRTSKRQLLVHNELNKRGFIVKILKSKPQIDKWLETVDVAS